jgi:PhnB protein
MQPVPYRFFSGTCREAMSFYARVFGAEDRLQILTVVDMFPDGNRPDGMPEAMPDAIMHAALPIGDGWLYASDDPTPGGAPPMAGVNISLAFPTEEETRRVFDTLAQGGVVRMPLTPMSWAGLFGMLTDRYGTRWMVQLEGMG